MISSYIMITSKQQKVISGDIMTASIEKIPKKSVSDDIMIIMIS
jgi:hypothetical protein